MTAGGTTPPIDPHGGPFGPQLLPPSGPQVPSPPGPPPYGVVSRPRRGGGVLTAVGIAVAIVLAAAALVVALTGVGRQPTPAAPPAAAPTAPPQPGASTATADRALCDAIAPLMVESNKAAAEFVNIGETGTPLRDAAIPEFRADTENWAERTQGVLDSHPNAQPFLKRTLQRYIDDLRLFVRNVRPGPKQTYDAAAWEDSLVAYGGPQSICQDLGVDW